MRCEVCKRQATPLFISYACDWCDGLAEVEVDRGFVVWRGRGSGAEEYVFRSRADAERWREVNRLEECPILEVKSERPFCWRESSGSVGGLELADHLYEIFHDHRFPPGPYRAFLACAASREGAESQPLGRSA